MQRLVRRVGAFVTGRPWGVLIALVVLTGLFGFFASQQEQTDDAAGATGPAAESSETIEERFGGDTATVQVLVSTEGRDVVNADAWTAVTSATEAVEASDAADRIEGFGDGPPVLSFLTPAIVAAEQLPGGLDDPDDTTVQQLQEQGLERAPAELAERADELFSATDEPAESGLMLVVLDVEGLDDDAQVELQRNVIAAVEGTDVPEGVTLEPFSFAVMLDGDIGGDIGRLFGIAFAVILAILAIVYWVAPAAGQRWLTARRTAADVALTLGAVVLAIGWMQGIGVLLGPDYLGLIGYFAPQTQVVPILIVGLGVDYAIHLTDRYREELASGTPPDRSLQEASATVGVALVLASITTAAGFLTNVLSPVRSLATLGVLAAVGILAALVMTLTFVPAVRALLDGRGDRRGSLPRDSLDRRSGDRLSKLAGATSVLARRAPAVTIAVALVLAALGAWGFTRLETEFSFTDFVPQDSPQLETFRTVQEEFGGSFDSEVDVLLTGPVATPEAHNGLVDAIDALTEVDAVDQLGGRADADSPLSVLRTGIEESSEVAAAAERAGVTEDLRVDPDADVAALYAALVEQLPDDSEQVLAQDGDGYSARVSARSDGQGDAVRLAEELRATFSPVADGGVEATPTSTDLIAAELNEDIRRSQLIAMALALGVAVLVLTAYYGLTTRRPLLGPLTVIPVALVIAWTFGTMALTGIPLTPVTATLAALAIGIGIDFAIHVLNRFLENRDQDLPVDQALTRTASSTGAALIGSAVTTLAGFGVLVTSDLVPFRQLGAVTVYAIGYSLLAAVLVFPSILALAERRRARSDDG